MTSARVAGPGPRTVAEQDTTEVRHAPGRPASRGPRSRRVAAVLAFGMWVAASLAACGAGPGPSGNAGPLASVAVSRSAGASGSGDSSGSAEPGSSVARWPGSTVLATIAMGAADGEIQKAGIDLQQAVDRQDLKAMWGAADGLARMIDGLMPNIERLESYPATQPAAAIYRQALPELSAGAKQLRDAITAGDSQGIVAGSQLIAKGLADYAPVRPIIAALVEQAIVQQRLLVQ